ncbi:MAG: helix-turn-helix transcriptional regulator, partial [Gorillibacterium sp.]|nr:helix-turn-helix transcriptional regulator [Gorillibacterium sp.]
LMHSRHVWLVVAEIDDYKFFFNKYEEAERKLCRFIVLNILNEIAQSFGAVESVYFPFNRYVFFIAPDEQELGGETGLRIGEAFQTALKRYMKLYEVQLSIGTSQIESDLADAPSAYDRALNALSQKFYTGKSSVNVYDPKFSQQSRSCYPTEVEKRILMAFKHNNEIEGNEMFVAFLDGLRDQGEAPDSIRFLTGEMLAGLFRDLREIKSMPVNCEMMETFINEIKEKETFEELRAKVKELITFILHTISIESCTMSPVAKGIEYMRIKLGWDISLQEVAKYVGMSPSYFSTLFKQEKNCNFVEYLVRMRMERSIELLERSDMTVAQVANEIGYMSYRYFIKVFKDYYELTPTQYRDGLR